MITGIKGVIFDLGSTLRFVHHDEAYTKVAKEHLVRLSGTTLSPEAFHQMVDERYENGYRKWAMGQRKEAGDKVLWCQWLLPDYKNDLIGKNAQELTYWYRQAKGIRKMVPHGKRVVKTLYQRGYRLGIISNLIGEIEIGQWLKVDGLEKYFSAVILSSICGIRKPDPEIYHLAACEMQLPLQRCVSVADNLDRDIVGAKEAGIGYNILFVNPEKLAKKTVTDHNRPDYIIHEFKDLLELLPAEVEAV